jgi:hypothetical protein
MHGPNTPRSTKGGKEATQIAADCSLGHVTPVGVQIGIAANYVQSRKQSPASSLISMRARPSGFDPPSCVALLPLHVFTNTITAQLPFPCSHFKLLQITNGRRTLPKKKGPGDGD